MELRQDSRNNCLIQIPTNVHRDNDMNVIDEVTSMKSFLCLGASFGTNLVDPTWIVGVWLVLVRNTILLQRPTLVLM